MEFDNKKLRELKKICKRLKKNISGLLIADINRAMAIKDEFYETESPVAKLIAPKENLLRRIKLVENYTGLYEKLTSDITDICLVMNKIAYVIDEDYKTTAHELELF